MSIGPVLRIGGPECLFRSTRLGMRSMVVISFTTQAIWIVQTDVIAQNVNNLSHSDMSWYRSANEDMGQVRLSFLSRILRHDVQLNVLPP